MKKFISKIFKKTGNLLIRISELILHVNRVEVLSNDKGVIESFNSVLIEKGQDRDLYKTRFGDLFWLDPSSCVDESIIDNGIWENYSTDVVNKLVKYNDYV